MGNHMSPEPEGIKVALNCMRRNPILGKFNISGNMIYDNDNVVNNASQLYEIVKAHPSIDTIHLGGCFGEEINSYQILCLILGAGASKLKEIYFYQNYIWSNGSHLLSKLTFGSKYDFGESYSLGQYA